MGSSCPRKSLNLSLSLSLSFSLSLSNLNLSLNLNSRGCKKVQRDLEARDAEGCQLVKKALERV